MQTCTSGGYIVRTGTRHGFFAVSITSGAIVKHIVLRPHADHDSFVRPLSGSNGLDRMVCQHALQPYSGSHRPLICFRIALCHRHPDDSGRLREKEETKFDPLSYKVILTLAVATSIDAMAVGVSMAFMQIGSSWDTIAIPAVLIAAISSALTIAGLGTGIFIGRKIPCSIAPVGGLILIGIGIKIIIEHLGLCS